MKVVIPGGTGLLGTCRYTPANRREIMDSRIDSTRVVGEAIAACAAPPPVWLQASTATTYAHRYDAPNDEHTGVIGGSEPGVPETWRFSIDVAQAWEHTLDAAYPARLAESGLTFEHPTWSEAARDLCARWRSQHGR